MNTVNFKHNQTILNILNISTLEPIKERTLLTDSPSVQLIQLTLVHAQYYRRALTVFAAQHRRMTKPL